MDVVSAMASDEGPEDGDAGQLDQMRGSSAQTDKLIRAATDQVVQLQAEVSESHTLANTMQRQLT